MWGKIGLIIIAIVLGYVSNAVSQVACLENAVFWYSQVLMHGESIYVKLEPGQEDVREALDNTHVPYTLLTPGSEKTAFPQVGIRTKTWIPFVISEQFDATLDVKKLARFTAYYVTLFGVPLSIGDSFDIPTPVP